MARQEYVQDYVYIVLIKALTGLGKVGRKITKYDYTHIALSMDEKLDDFITFSRKKHYSPFESGYMHETRDCYIFGRNEKVKIKVFKLPVKKENLKKINTYIKKIEKDPEYIFNLYSMLTMPIINGFRIYKAHNCMSFIAKIIELSQVVSMDKRYYKYTIKDMDELLSNFLYYEDYIRKYKDDNKNYMDRIGIIKNIKFFCILNGKLLYRMIRKGGKSHAR